MDLIGTMLVGPNEKGLRGALQGLKDCGCEAIHVLVDLLDDESHKLLDEFNCTVFTRPWSWEFGPARTALQETIPDGTKWQLWLDSDDMIPLTTCEKIKQVVASSEPARYFMPYVYVNDVGAESMRLFRLRLFPPEGVTWRLRAHEYAVFERELPEYYKTIMPILHVYQQNEPGRGERYIEGLTKDLQECLDDTRIMHYLGQSLYGAGQNDAAIEIYQRYLATGGWDEERMKTCLELSHMFQLKGDLSEALKYAKQAFGERINRREPCQRVAEIYSALQDWQQAYEWLIKELDIPYPENERLLVSFDHYRQLPYEWLILPSYHLGKMQEGLRYTRKILEYDPDNTLAKHNVTVFNDGLRSSYIPDTSASPVAYFYVGLSCERWNSESVNTVGIGGRETSNIWMAKEFSKLGWEVVLFSDCQGMEGSYDGVENVDYSRFADWCTRQPPDVMFTSGRTSVLDLDFVAKMKVFWIHDIGWGNNVTEWPDYLTDERREKVDKFFFMSPSQQDLLIKTYNLPQEKGYLTRSGIKVDRFSGAVPRNRHRLIYTSSADRGLEHLLSYWPEIKERAPQAELHVFYGFLNAIVSARSVSEENGCAMERWVTALTDRMESLPGVEYYDRVPQDQLAVEFQKSAVWAYPTHFQETMCLSALEASAAGCAVVTSDLAALHTTVGRYGTLLQGHPESEEYDRRFIGEVVRLLTDDVYWKSRCALSEENVYNQTNKFGTRLWDWEAIAQEWNEYLREELGYTRPDFHALDDGAAYDYIKTQFQDFMQYRHEVLWAMECIRNSVGTDLGVIVEIGSGFGANLGMLSRLGDGEVISIDFSIDLSCSIQMERVLPFFPNDNIKFFKGRSQDPQILSAFSDYLGDRKIDLLIIDGGHSYEEAIADWNNMLPFLSENAVVMFHDVDGSCPCTAAFNEVAQSYSSDKLGNTGIIYVGQVCDNSETPSLWDDLLPGGTRQLDYENAAYFISQYQDGKITGDQMLGLLRGTKTTTSSGLRSIYARTGFNVLSVSSNRNILTAAVERPAILDKDAFGALASDFFGTDVVYPDALYGDSGEIQVFDDNLIIEPELSVIVIAHRRLQDRTIPCLQSLRSNIGNVRYELICVDDGSQDGTAELFRCHADRTAVLTPRQGICCAANTGIKLSQSTFVCVVQNDVAVPEELIQNMLDGLRRHPDWGMVAGWYSEWQYCGVETDGFVIIPCELDKPNRSAWDYYVPGPCRIYRKAAFVQAGLFDEFQYNAWDDHDTVLAIQAAGYKVAACVEPKYTCFASDVIEPVTYTQEQRVRRFLSFYYFHLKWNYVLEPSRFESLGV